MSERLLQQARDERRFQPELFRVGDVLPRAAAASRSRRNRRTEMRALGCDAIRRGTEDVDECRRTWRRIAVTAVEGYADAFAGNCEGDGNRPPPGAGDAVAGLVQV